MRHLLLLTALAAGLTTAVHAQRNKVFTHADTLRGSNGPGRAWWDVTFYDLHVKVHPADSTIAGWNGIAYTVLSPGAEMQIDLQEPMQIDSMIQNGKTLRYRRDGNAFFARMTNASATGSHGSVRVYFHGKLVAAVRPPWDGGYIWQHDSAGDPWIATANQGVGASIWWPNKDIQADEPDSQRIAITMPDPMQDISNGRLRKTTHNSDGTTTYEWFVSTPINNYDVAVNAGTYAHFSDIFAGELGPLTMDFWPLAIHLDTAKVQFQQAKKMMACFEHWFGSFPWYADGYKLVEAPHLGMEHQTAVAYGNHYKNGYFSGNPANALAPGRATDLSGTGEGFKWDFIIVHESAHEWFGNSITANDAADGWIHESFANYAEGLFSECQDGKAAGATYMIGSRRNIRNDSPIIGPYGVNQDGSGDMYYKGGNMLHMMRQLVDNDEKWRGVLRGLSKTFWHQTVTTQQIEQFMSREAGIDFSKIFDQYLRTKNVPTLEYRFAGGMLSYRWADVVPGFHMDVKATVTAGQYSWLHPTEAWQTIASPVSPAEFGVDENFYVRSKNVGS